MDIINSLEELRDIWLKERLEYEKSEIGSGVQDFVYNIFQCQELFGLKKGLKSTPQEERSYEFLLEEGTGKEGRADAVIFIDQNIIIPVEVEKLHKAKSGEWQILKYRTAFDKKYGILTDGYEWRFYYGEIEDSKYYKFTFDQISSDPRSFKLFWEEYIQPENYYLSFFEEIGQQRLELFGKEKIRVDEYRTKFFNDITDVIKKLESKLINTGFLVKIENAFERKKKATEIAYSYLIQFILYKTLVDNNFSDFANEFCKKEELIYQNLKRGSYNSILMILEGLGVKISENIYKPFNDEQKIILEEVKNIVHAGNENLMNVTPFLDIFVFIRKYDFSNVQNDIFGSIYENYLKELFEEKNFGQYFTAPEVVNFMLEEVEYTAEEIQKKDYQNISIVDPSCGSGTFLYSAVRELLKSNNFINEQGSIKIEKEIVDNIFGLDIAEFPLYLSEMSILMKILPIVINEKYNNPIDKKLKLFMTEDSVSEFIGEIGGRRSGKNSEQTRLALGWRYAGFMRDDRDLDDMKRSLNNVGSGSKIKLRSRFDYVIGNPPYIGYNECSKIGIKIFKLLKSKNNVSLNDIYGWNLHSTPKNRKKYSPKPNLYAFFIALGFALLKRGGKFCYIVPQTLLTAGDLDVIRYQLVNEYKIEKIITFAGNLFVGRGINQNRKIATSSLILVCTKEKAKSDHEVECIYFPYENWEVEDIFGEIRSNRKKYSKNIFQNSLKDRTENWNFIKWNENFLRIYEKYRQNSESIEIYYNHEKAKKIFGSNFWFDIGYNIDEKKRLRDRNLAEYFFPKIDNKNLRLEEDGYWINQREKRSEFEIKLLTTNQGYSLLDSVYKVFWSYINTQSFYFCDRPVIWARNKYCAIGSNNKEEILYLFSLLNSKLIMKIIFNLLGNKHEKSLLVSVNAIKTYVRTPLINTPEKEIKKQKIIELTQEIIDMEKQTIGDLVEIDTLMQSFSGIKVKLNRLILISNGREFEFEIKPGKEILVGKVIETMKKPSDLLTDDRQEIFTLSQIKKLSVYNKDEKIKIKNQIDELIFDLYGLTEKDRCVD